MASRIILKSLGVLTGTLVATSALGDSCLIEPVKISPNMVTSVFGKTRDLAQYPAPRVHWGVDLQARNPQNPAVGADLVAADDGVVVGAGYWGSGYGNRVAIKRANGDIILYNHMAKIEPSLKSGGAVGFAGSPAGVGEKTVSAGDKIGVAGGTANHASSNEMPIHLHLEYVTGYAGDKIRETNDGTTSTRSRYMRNALSYMCRPIALAPGAGDNGAGGRPTGSGSVTNNGAVPNSDEQIAEAGQTQPSVTDRERYGIPDAAPYVSYDGMSESQIVEAEMLRRTLDTEWEEKLTRWGKRGLWMELARMRAVKVWLEARIAEKQQRIEGMLSSKLAFQTNVYFNPRLENARNLAEKSVARQYVK